MKVLSNSPSVEFSNPQNDVRMDGVYFFAAGGDQVAPRFALKHGHYAYCFMVCRGDLTLHISFPNKVSYPVTKGDIVGISGLVHHHFSLAGEEADSSGPVVELQQQPVNNVSDDAEVDLLIGVVPSESLALSNMVLGAVVVSCEDTPDISRRIWKAADLLEDEFFNATPELNQSIVVRRVAEIMLINMTRWFAVKGSSDLFLTSGLATDAGVVQALFAFINDPFKEWTVDSLAKTACMSRTKFSECFRRATQATPIQTITRMRLRLIAQRMLQQKLTVDEAADLAVYSSASAFIRAFQKEFGITPSRWRKDNYLQGLAQISV